MLFKYLAPDRIDVIQNLKIRFTPLTSLNDPYEALPIVCNKELIKTQIENITAEVDRIWLKMEHEEKTETKRLQLKSAQNKAIEYAKEHSVSLGREVIDLFGDSFGVLSLSRCNSNLLMWSHYTESHSGFVLGFDDTNDFFHEITPSGLLSHPEPVNYSQIRNEVKQNTYNFRKNMLCQKPIDWAYEQEERIFRAEMDKSRSLSKDLYDNDIVLFDIPPESIRAIYIGHNASDNTKDAIFESVLKYQLNCTIYTSRMSATEYKIIFTELNIPNVLI